MSFNPPQPYTATLSSAHGHPYKQKGRPTKRSTRRSARKATTNRGALGSIARRGVTKRGRPRGRSPSTLHLLSQPPTAPTTFFTVSEVYVQALSAQVTTNQESRSAHLNHALSPSP